MAHINDHKKRHDFYKSKGLKAMSGKTPGDRFSQHVDDTVDNVVNILDNLQSGTATFEDARLDLANYKANTKNIWNVIKNG